MYLTPKQREVYEFIKRYIDTHDIAPSYEEIQHHFGFRSVSTVFDHIKTLARKGAIERGGANSKRALQVVGFGKRSVTIPLVATVAAGSPLEVYEIEESVDVPEELLGGGENVALKVRGSSMIDSGIFDGDVIVVRRQNTAENGQIVVALVDGGATVKRVYYQGDRIELRASNPEVPSIFVTGEQNLEIYGILVGMFRKFNV